MTAAATAERTWSTTEIAAALDLPQASVWRWARQLGHAGPGPGGSPGHGIRLTAADAATIVTWVALGIAQGGAGAAQLRGLRGAIAEAHRVRPAPYVVATPIHAVAVDSLAEAAEALRSDWARPAATFINITGAPPWSA